MVTITNNDMFENKVTFCLVSRHLVVSGLQLAVDGSMLLHPGSQLLLISLNVLSQSGGKLLAYGGRKESLPIRLPFFS